MAKSKTEIENQLKQLKMDERAMLHDEFAKAAMAALMLDPSGLSPEEVAELSYKYADAMLRKRDSYYVNNSNT